jgi:hypothetical protein
MEYHYISQKIEAILQSLFSKNTTGINQREDSRAFGAMIEKTITDNWEDICNKNGFEFIENPGRRTIYDFACKIDGYLLGFDVKTKDLEKSSYSDGGVCAVGNLLKFIANENGYFFIVEVGHKKSQSLKNSRDIQYIKVSPFHIFPVEVYRIENLGTGQLRLNETLLEMNEKNSLTWNKPITDFLMEFSNLCIQHYQKVIETSTKRIDSIENFRDSGYSKISI